LVNSFENDEAAAQAAGESSAGRNADLQKQIWVEQRVTNDGKSIGIAYLLWFFFGTIGGHRFYLGRVGSAIAMLLITVLTLGLGLIITGIWAIIDAFLIPNMVGEENDKLRRQLYQEVER